LSIFGFKTIGYHVTKGLFVLKRKKLSQIFTVQSCFTMNCFSITSQIEFLPREAKDYEPQWNKLGSLILFLKVGMLKKDDGIVSKKGIKTSAWPCNGFGLKQNHEK
jgi:hypothetical protein